MRLLLVVVAGLAPAGVAAQPAFGPSYDQANPPSEPLARPALVSATITPFAVPWEIFELTQPDVFPIVAMSVEVRVVHPSLGVALMGLAGEENDTGTFVNSHETFFEVGAEPRWYFLGGFRGPMAGAALHYFRMHMILTDAVDGRVLPPYEFAGYTYGLFVGYKYTADIGFTVEVKAGVEAVNRTVSDSGPHPTILPMTDAKVGWSF